MVVEKKVPVVMVEKDQARIYQLEDDLRFDTGSGAVSYTHLVIRNAIEENITKIVQIDSLHYFIGTDVGIHYAELKNNILSLSPCDKLDTLQFQINELYFHKGSNKVFIGTFQKGIFVYDLNLHHTVMLKSGLEDISINRICIFGDNRCV